MKKSIKSTDLYFFYTDIDFSTIERLLFFSPETNFDLYFTTQGGDPYASIFMGNYLKENNYLRDIICVGEVNSGGNIVLALCKGIKKRKAYPYVSFLLHSLKMNLTDSVYTQYVEHLISSSKNLNNIILDIYKEKLDLTKDEQLLLEHGVNLMFDTETALKKGLIDEIIE